MGSEITGAHLAALQRIAKTYSAGEMVCVEGEPTQDLMLMLKGSIEVVKDNEVINTIRGSNIFLGHLAFFTNQRRTASLRAKSRCEIVRVREDKVTGLLSSMPSLSLKLIKDIAEMFLRKEEQISRFQRFGGGAKDAMRAEGIADLVAEYLPALVACSVCNLSEEHRLEILLGFVDGVASKLQLSERGTRKDSIPAQINNKALKAALNAGFGQMIRMKTSDENGLDGVIERGREHAQEISDTLSAIDTSTSALAGERVSLGIESQLKKLLPNVMKVKKAVASEEFEQALDSAKSLCVEGAALVRFSDAQRNDELVREESASLFAACENVSSILEAVVHLDRASAIKKQLLTYFRFEI